VLDSFGENLLFLFPELRNYWVHLDTTTGTPDLSGSGPCDISLCRINPAFRLAFPSLWVVVSSCTHQLLDYLYFA